MPERTTRRPGMGPAELDDQLQRAVLDLLLIAYPAPFTLNEIVTALEHPFDPSFQERDDIQRAVRDLTCAGLLRERSGTILPTRATARFRSLTER